MSRQSANRATGGARTAAQRAAQAAELAAQVVPAGETVDDVSPARRSLDALLGRLDSSSVVAPRPTTALLSQAEADVDDHAESLRVTLKAQQEAERLLGAASVERREASEQAARIIDEAKAAAERLNREAQRHVDRAQKEATAWSTEQRAKVEALVAELVESATEDAETTRKDALISAMAEAEEAAEQYVARSAARANRDADAVRAEAQSVLKRSRAVLAESTESVRTIALTLASFVEGLQQHAGSMEGLLGEAAARLATADGADVELTLTSPPSDSSEAAEVPGVGDPAQDAPSGIAESETAQRRPLGSLFRGQEA